MKKMYHITSRDVAEKIKQDGFAPKQVIANFKYFSEMGKDGVYFYDNLRLVQQYAYFFKGKSHKDLAMITVEVPSEFIRNTDRQEDGFFVQRKDLKHIKILKVENVDSIRNIY